MIEKKITFWYLFFSHHPYSELDRTLKLNLFNKKVYLCARCTGQYLALFLFMLFQAKIDYSSIPFEIISILPLFATLDWLTQTLEIRKSNNYLRVITGGVFGVWLGIILCSIINLNFNLLIKLSIQSLIYFIIVLSILFFRRDKLNKYLKPYEKFIQKYEQQRCYEDLST
ncbi:DUF2085 domain-containing protein [Orenia marismortui]|uniref:DUF2085 domain-containing protein n=1 Tax=Orenia marismortui TaxID=46469 RepID=UPI000372B16F|nr:DUF2085 domain-containing protein [Orenia marismortui]